MDKIVLKSNLVTWVVFSANASAADDFSRGEKGFYALNPNAKLKEVIGSDRGYPVKAWPFSPGINNSNALFVDEYNKKMEKLINEK